MIGHRTYLDNPRLVVTQPRKEPLMRGHRKWLDIECRIDGARASQSWLFRDRDRVILKGLEDERKKR